MLLGGRVTVESTLIWEFLGLFTVRVQSEMLSSNSRSGASFFIAHAWRLNVCLWVTTLVSLTRQKIADFFRPGWAWSWDETASPKSYAVGHAEDYIRKP